MGPGMWTGSGHYIAVVGYENGLYKVYDPASSARTGWHPWSDFAGQIKICYNTNRKWGEVTPEEWKATGTATCSENGVNVRATPGGTIIGQLNSGQRFEIDGKADGSWTHVKIAGIGIAWMHSDYVAIDGPQPLPFEAAYKFTLPQMSIGYQGREVTLIERVFKARNMYKLSVDQSFGPGVQKAVLKLQSLRSLVEDGIYGPATSDAMFGLNHDGMTFYVLEVSIGCEGESVRLMQELLRADGYYTDGAVDGCFGPITKKALKKYKKDKGLKNNAVCDSATWKVLIGI